MQDYKILNLICTVALQQLQEIQVTQIHSIIQECQGFLCQKDGTCKSDTDDIDYSHQRCYNIIVSVTHVYLCVGSNNELAKLYLPIIDKIPGWAFCFDRKHVSSVFK